MPDDHAAITPADAPKRNNVPPPAEYRWKPGQSGNPGGRPKGLSITAALRDLLDKEHNGKRLAEILADRWMKEALMGKFPHLKELLDRTEGRPEEVHKIIGPPRAKTWRSVMQDFSKLPDEEVIAFHAHGGHLSMLPPALQEKAYRMYCEQQGIEYVNNGSVYSKPDPPPAPWFPTEDVPVPKVKYQGRWGTGPAAGGNP